MQKLPPAADNVLKFVKLIVMFLFGAALFEGLPPVCVFDSARHILGRVSFAKVGPRFDEFGGPVGISGESCGRVGHRRPSHANDSSSQPPASALLASGTFVEFELQLAAVASTTFGVHI